MASPNEPFRAAGAPGYPNLNDDDWLWGGSIDQVCTTITHGVRAADGDTHFNLMPNFGMEALLTALSCQMSPSEGGGRSRAILMLVKSDGPG